jgi:hypothetical protein
MGTVIRRSLTIFPCDCCGRPKRPVHGFLLRGDERVGLYLANVIDVYEDGGAALDIALGLSDGVTVALRVESDGIRARMRLMQPEKLSLYPARTLGRWLTREDAALRLRELRPIVEAILDKDRRLFEALELPPPTTRRERVA